ncbi:MAG: hypothetical protein WC389_05550 [Lutibacter sp.]|jgi:hypothetical protein
MDKLKKVIDEGITQYHLSSDISSIREGLKDYGVNLDENSARQEKLIKQLKFKLKASINKEKYENLLDKAVNFYEIALNKGLDKPVVFFKQLINQNQVTFQYKNLDKLSTEEIKEIIKDQNLVEIIEMLENEQ